MKTSWATPAIWLASLVSSASCRHILPPAEATVSSNEKRGNDAHVFVFRGEYGRTPQSVDGAGGLMSKGYARNFESPLTATEKGWGSSLTEHISGRNKPISLWVSTTYDPKLAMKFASGGQTSEFYIYDIAPDKKAIDVQKSITKFEASYAATQKEVAFVKGIPNEQIKGHYVLKPSDYNPTEELSVEGFRKRFADRYVPNSRFNERYLTTEAPAKQVQFDKLYTGPTTVQQETFAKSYAETLGKKELQSPESAVKDLQSFFEKASPKERLLDSSRPNWSQPNAGKPNGGVGEGSKPGEVPVKEGQKPGGLDVEAKPQPAAPEVEVKPAAPEVEVKPATPEIEVKPQPQTKPDNSESLAINPQKELPGCKRGLGIACDPFRMLQKEPSVKPGEKAPTPQELETKLTQKKVKAAVLAESVSEKEFAAIVKQRKLGDTARNRFSLAPSEVRTEIVKYKPITPSSPSLSGALGHVTGGILTGIGSALWFKDVVTTFTTDTDAYQKTAVVTSLIPIVGCITQDISNAAHGAGNSIDTLLCLLGDGLLLSGAGSVFGVLVHIARFILSLIGPSPPQPSNESVLADRDRAWNDFLDGYLYAYIYSSPLLSDTLTEPPNSFGKKLRSTLAADEFAMVSNAAETIGVLTALSAEAAEDATSEQARLEIGNSTYVAIQDTHAKLAAEIARRQRQLLLGIPTDLRTSPELSIDALATTFNKNFCDGISTDEKIREYVSKIKIGYWGPSIWERFQQAEDALYEIEEHVAANPPPLPSLFAIAYTVGQSKGLAVDATVLSSRAHLQDTMPTMSTSDVDAIAIRQTQAIMRYIIGSLRESELPDEPLIEDKNILNEVRIIIALRIGQRVEEHKMEPWLGKPVSSMGKMERWFIAHPKTAGKTRTDQGLDLDSSYFISSIVDLPREAVEAVLG